MNFNRLYEPFHSSELEHKPAQAGFDRNGKPYVVVLTYVSARACQNRLDEVFGLDGWRDEYVELSEAGKITGFKCRLSVRIKRDDGTEEWLTKEDVAPISDFESLKGGASGAFKRVCASGFGIGRYLYNLEATFGIIRESGRHFVKCKQGRNDSGTPVRWDPPQLPAWALPEDERGQDTGAKAEDSPKYVGPSPKMGVDGPPGRTPGKAETGNASAVVKHKEVTNESASNKGESEDEIAKKRRERIEQRKNAAGNSNGGDAPATDKQIRFIRDAVQKRDGELSEADVQETVGLELYSLGLLRIDELDEFDMSQLQKKSASKVLAQLTGYDKYARNGS